MDGDVVPKGQRVPDQELLNAVGLQGAWKSREVSRAQIIWTVTRPQEKKSEREIVRYKDRAHKLQASVLPVVKRDKNYAGANLRKHAEVNELQEVKKRKREGAKCPVRQLGNGPTVKNPFVHRIKRGVVGEVEADRDDDAVVGEHQEETGKQINGGRQNGSGVPAQFGDTASFAEFEQGDGIDCQNHRLHPAEGPGENAEVEQQERDSNGLAPVTLEKRCEDCLSGQPDEAQGGRNENRLRREDEPVRDSERFPIETQWKVQKPEGWNESRAEEQADPVMPVTRLHWNLYFNLAKSNAGSVSNQTEALPPGTDSRLISGCSSRKSTTASIGK